MFRMIRNEIFQIDVAMLGKMNVFKSDYGLFKVRKNIILGSDPISFGYLIILPLKHEIVTKFIGQ